MVKKNRVCIIDIGSNTVKMSVFDAADGKTPRAVFSKSRVLSLVNKRENGALSREGLVLLIMTLSEYKALAEEKGATVIRACATASLRGISNTSEVLQAIEAATGIAADILSPEREAQISFDGLVSLLPPDSSGIMADMGGGSCELVLFKNGGIIRKTSLGFGCASLYKAFVAGEFPLPDEVDEINAFVSEKLGNESLFAGEKNMYLVGGTAKSAAALSRYIAKDNRKPDLYEFGGFFDICDFLLTPSPVRDALVEKVIPDRKTTVTPGMCAFRTLFYDLRCEKIIVASTGLREGYLSGLISGGEI